jgi:crotonobetainyl-CoA:carnitine CoA-transferase CaiB-like acyl-CoA transferase
LNIAANEQKQFETLCDLIGRPALKTDLRFAEREARKRHRDQLRALIEEALGARSAEEWEDLLNRNGVPAGRVLSVPEILAEPQVTNQGFVERVFVPGFSETLRVTRPGFRFVEDFPPPGAPPALGAHTRLWLERIGCAPDDIEALARDGVVALAENETGTGPASES